MVCFLSLAPSPLSRTGYYGRALTLLFVCATAIGVRSADAQTAIHGYVTNQCSGTISVFDTATNRSVATIPGGLTPFDVALTPDGTRAYVTNIGGGDLSFIDTTTNRIVGSLLLGAGSAPARLVFTPDGTRAYVTTTNFVVLIDTATNQIISITRIDGFSIAITPDGTKVYVTEPTTRRVAVLPTALNFVTTWITLDADPVDVAIAADGTRAYVTLPSANAIVIVDTATDTVVGRWSVPNAPEFLAVTPDGSRVFVALDAINAVSVIDTATGAIIANVPTGRAPAHVEFTPDGATAYVTNVQDNTITVIDTATLTVATTLTGFACPGGIAIGAVPAPAAVPTDKSQCKDGGYQRFGPPAGPFRNQGQCVAYVEHHTP